MERKCLILKCPRHPKYEGKIGVVVAEKQSPFNTRDGYVDTTVYIVNVDGKRVPWCATDEDLEFL